MNKNAFNYRLTVWITSIVIFVLIAILVVIQYFWITAMVDMRKSMMTESMFLAFNECAHEIIAPDDETLEEDELFIIVHSTILPEQIIEHKTMIDNTIKYYMENNEVTVPYYWAVVEQNETKALIENDLAYLKDTKKPAQTYRISSIYPQFSYELVIQFFSSRWQVPNVVFSTIFVLGFCLIILVTGILYNTRLYYKRQKETDSWIDFIGNMVHEFKTPMATISLASEMMMRSNTVNDPDRILQYSSLIYKENHHQRNMIDKLLRMVSLDVSAMALDFVPVNVHEEIQTITESFSLRIEEKGGKLVTDLNATEPIISGDKMHIFNVINNLLENAEKYSNDAPQIHIETKNDAHGLYISVKDNGIGISPKHQKKLFRKFYRVRSDRSYSDSGYGLGLFYVNYVMRAHHGNIHVTSKENSGSTFELYFPYKRL